MRYEGDLHAGRVKDVRDQRFIIFKRDSGEILAQLYKRAEVDSDGVSRLKALRKRRDYRFKPECGVGNGNGVRVDLFKRPVSDALPRGNEIV